MEDMRMRMGMGDGRNPYGSEGGYVVSSRGGRGRRRGRGRGRRGDRGMDYGMYDMRSGDYGDYAGDMARGGRGNSRGGQGGGRGRGGDRGDMGNYDYGDMRGGDMRRSNYGDMARGDRAGGMDGHYPMHGGQSMGGQTYYPIEAMGRFNGYWGMPEQDYGRGGRGGRDYGYDMRGGDYGDYGYDYGDYGETLSEEELEKWCKKLKQKLDEREKQMFTKESIMQKVKQMNKPMEGFGEKEIEVVTLMLYDDYKKTLGQSPEIYIKLAFDWLEDKDSELKGAEKLAVYFDEIVEGGEE